MSVSSPSINELARRLANLEKRISKGVSQPQLAYSAIEDGAVHEYDREGTLTGIMGLQFDGTHIAASFNGPIPPQPEPPTVDERVEGFNIRWSGYLENAPHIIPMDYLRMDVHVSAVGALFVPDDTTRVGSITSPRGGELTIARSAGVQYWFKLVMVTQSGQMSLPSTAETGIALSTGQSSDGDAPGAIVDITLTGGVGILLARWTPVVNNDLVEYDVYVSSVSGFTPGPLTLVHSGAEASFTIRKLADGTALSYDTTYYVKVIPRDADGSNLAAPMQASGQMYQAQNVDISADYAYIGKIIVDQLLGGTLTADILFASTMRTAETGSRVEIGPFGQIIYNPSGVPITVFPTDGSANKFKGDVEADGLTVSGTASIRSLLEIAKAANITLNSATSATPSPPTVVVNWPDPIVENLFSGNYGLTWTGTDWATVGDSVVPLIQTHASTDVFLPSGSPRPWGGLTNIGGNWYVLGFSGSPAVWYVTKYNSAGVQQAQVVYTPLDGPWGSGASLGGALAPAAIGNDGTNVLVAEFDDLNNRYRILTLNPTTLATTSTMNTSASTTFAGPVVGVKRGTFDLGVTRTVILSRNNSYFYTFDTGGTYQPNDAWAVPVPGSMSGFDWDGTRFWSTRAKSVAANAWVYKHTTTNWSGIDPQTWYVGTTWKDTDAGGTGLHETNVGAVQAFSMKKRAAITLTSAAIPDSGGVDDPDSVYFYLGKVDADRLNLWLQTQPASGVNTITLKDNVVFTGTHPPATSNFPDETPAQIKSAALAAADALPKTLLKGDGTGRIQAVIHGYHFISTADQASTDTGTWSNATGFSFPADAGVKYAITVTVFLQNSSGGTADVHFGFNWTGTGRMHLGQMGNDATMSGGAYNGTWTGHAVLNTTTSPARDGTAIGTGNTFPTVAQIHATYECTTAGTVQLEFAQMTTTAGQPTSIKRGSRMKAEAGS
jgi:hypothetical protein